MLPLLQRTDKQEERETGGNVKELLVKLQIPSNKEGTMISETGHNGDTVCLNVNACPLSSSERCLEDHELVVQVQASMSSDSKFLFRKNYAKYEFFRNPLVSLSRPESVFSFRPLTLVKFCRPFN
ncbi:Growth factor receptor-bound protein 10 [Liparis tanakae]|uniref:Growth factor receptor-bound protein 10 n=1 Tax=Liparis tanakae TaxID=230148 RepID=A0A4Z2E3K4_9TELE|nr:Growth factor receptor-bound protein 10 [Liparis tanakae]